METIMAYQTTDGKLFTSSLEAEKHEANLTRLSCINSFIRENNLPDTQRVIEVVQLWEDFRNKQVLNRGINSLSLSKRSIDCLKAANITTVAELLQYSENNLRRFPNLGRKALNEIKEILHGNGWHLSENSK